MSSRFPVPGFRQQATGNRRPFLPCTLVCLVALFSLNAVAQTPESIIQRELAASRSYETLEQLTDDIGPRLSGSANADAAVAWALRTFAKWDIPAKSERVMVPHGARGIERAALVSHHDQNIVLTALGGSVATPAAGITADVVELSSYDELKQLGAKVRGRIVYYNNPMDPELVKSGRAFEAYSRAVIY